MDDPNITMEEYIRVEEEKAHRHGKVFNGKRYAIVFNNNVTSNETLSCEPTVSSLNDEIDFRISFDESDDEDYMVVFHKNSFSYKIFSTNDLKTDSKNDNEKVKKPLFPPPEPTVSCFDDLDFFKDFENEFSAIVYNDALTSKSDFLIEPTEQYGDLAETMIWYGYIKNHKKTVKNGQVRTRESEEYKKKPKNQSRSQKSQTRIKKKEKGAKGVFTIHPSLPNFTMVKREGKQELMGIKGNSSSLFKDSREKSVIPRLLIG
ncbi:hypothetical protein Tco_0217198 [Tanacetum coccineum]